MTPRPLTDAQLAASLRVHLPMAHAGLHERTLVESGLPADQASADGLRYALCIIVFTFLWSTFHYYRAMRTLRQEELPA